MDPYRESGLNPITQTYKSADMEARREVAQRAAMGRRLAARGSSETGDNLESSLVPTAEAETASFGRVVGPAVGAAGAGPGQRTSAQILQEQYDFDTLTQSYRAPDKEAAARAEEAARHAAQVRAHEHARLQSIEDRSGYNIVSHETSKPIPPNSLCFLDPPVDAERTTANHTHYDFDVITGEPKPRDHASIEPSVRAGRRPPATTDDASQAARPPPSVSAAYSSAHPSRRTYDILNGHVTAPVPGPDAQPRARGKRRGGSKYTDHNDMLVWDGAPVRDQPPVLDGDSYKFF
ncbi:uncharacterized protein AMSG_05441 [Thecamonas trahens ATCC 50062]|uniref:Uncharacterized protein n=1 Tax=Thecamonas trahens ATCC 50062 TaxID=461836 RepID=A0A0L0DB21_THETB|nr:hypothetical protein AMSG_05441 [Thecamonas trahens ATCC 50062]KNC49435.1 hypothetical protein AMSG_05441 [Thecamonas trahens ATCC 50062]|eukprot:XP_013757857.1 hypothetical protein AMSG_05441 [Thecamonas trahens ATCC 50062]